MSDIQNYQISYLIDVKTSDSAQEINKFAKSIDKITEARTRLDGAVSNIKKMMDEIDAAFRTKGGKKRDYSYNINIETNKTEEKLNRVVTLLRTIKELSGEVKLVINAGNKLDSKTILAQSKALIDNQKKVKETSKKNAATVAKEVTSPLTRIESIVGRVNAALISLEKGREIQIQTDVSKKRLQEILGLLQQIKGASKMTLGMGMASPPGSKNVQSNANTAVVVSGSSGSGKVLNTTDDLSPSDARILKETLKEQEQIRKSNFRLKRKAFRDSYAEGKKQEALYESARLMSFGNKMKREEAEQKQNQKILKDTFREMDLDSKRISKSKRDAFWKSFNSEKKYEEEYEKARVSSLLKKETEKAKAEAKIRNEALRNLKRQTGINDAIYGNTRRSAINRLQFNRGLSWRSLPMVGMLNAYMAYGTIRSELSKAVDYSNTMESAKSILRVSDGGKDNFEERFSSLTSLVRSIGVQTKFQAKEVADATRFLAMAGFGINDVSQSMRPIANLAIIGDNDLAQVADLTTNMMSGYNIKSNSMGAVADVVTSTTSRSNVNILEMAESFKMASGHLRLAGIDFTEAAAAIGILGNSGMKGTLSGTALRAMATRIISPTKKSTEILERLGVTLTHIVQDGDRKVEKLRPLAEIFKDLYEKGATLPDMLAVFGKTGGAGAMHLISGYERLRELTDENKYSHGISEQLAEIKQNTVKGLWAQLTSQFSESFMQAYESLEPIIRSVLSNILEKFRAPEFAKGLAAIGHTLLNVFNILSKIGIWFTNNFHWIQPILFTGFVTTRIIKLASALTNIGVAIGFIGKQKALSATVSGIAELGGLVPVLGGNKAAPLLSEGKAISGTASSIAAQQSVKGLLATQVSTGGGLLGAIASLGTVGWGFAAATAGFAALAGAIGYAAYKTYQLNEAKESLLEDIRNKDKFRYPSIEALNLKLQETYQKALAAKGAVDGLTEQSLEEATKQPFGFFSPNSWRAFFNTIGQGSTPYLATPGYSFLDAEQDNLREAFLTKALKDAPLLKEKAFKKLSTLTTPEEILAFERNLPTLYGVPDKQLDYSLFSMVPKKGYSGKELLDENNNPILIPYYNTILEKDGKTIATKDVGESIATHTWEYANHINHSVLPDILSVTTTLRTVLENNAAAVKYMGDNKFPIQELKKMGFYQDKDGVWALPSLKENATSEEITEYNRKLQFLDDRLETFTKALRDTFGYQGAIASNIINKAGWSQFNRTNEPLQNKELEKYLALTSLDEDDQKAGGNYGGNGKVSSAAPKQVVVNISNLLSVQTIDLMKSPDGQQSEIQNLKEQLAQALIDVVHDFDASWNG